MKNIIILLSTITVLIFTGCSKHIPENSSDKFDIVTSFYPIYILTLNIADGINNVNITNMAQPQTGCLHDYQLTTKDMKTLNTADIFIANGAGMESFMDKALELHPNLSVVDTSKGVDLVESSADHSNHDHDELNHDFEEYNSHIWLSLPNAIKQVENIKNSLCEADPNNSKYYKENSEIFVSKLNSLYSEIQLPISNNKTIAVFHEGFDYIAHEYNITIGATIQIDENIQTSARQMGSVIDDVKNKNITALFAGDDSGKIIAEAVASETNSKVYLLDPITSGSMSPDAYITAMKNNFETIKEALK